jgi:uncharacterized protein YjeT (DUF2065 family)
VEPEKSIQNEGRVMKLLVALLGLVLILEGLPYVAFPEAMQNWLRQLQAASPVLLRILGTAAVLLGLFLCFLAQRTRLLG